jgi:hypothetical protein
LGSLACVLLVLLCVLRINLNYRYLTDTTPIPFDQNRWATEPFIRHQMIDSLINDHNLVGMTREEASALLGHTATSFLIENRPPAGDLTPSTSYMLLTLSRRGIPPVLFRDGGLRGFELTYDENDCVASWRYDYRQE